MTLGNLSITKNAMKAASYIQGFQLQEIFFKLWQERASQQYTYINANVLWQTEKAEVWDEQILVLPALQLNFFLKSSKTLSYYATSQESVLMLSSLGSKSLVQHSDKFVLRNVCSSNEVFPFSNSQSSSSGERMNFTFDAYPFL